MALAPILCITGSDSTGVAGIQADIRTASDLGAYAVTVITAITVQNRQGIRNLHPLPEQLVVEQTETIVSDMHPKAVKIGMLANASLCKSLRDELVGCRNIVLDPGFLAYLHYLEEPDLYLQQLCCHLIPLTTLLILRCAEAELLLGKGIHSDDDMVWAARQLSAMGAEWVFLRNGSHTDGRLSALLYCAATGCDEVDRKETIQFFSSLNTEGWQKHGVGGALSSAIATRLGQGDDMQTAIGRAHEYLHHQIVYSIESNKERRRPAEIYNAFMSLVAKHYASSHLVEYYADQLCVSKRYLSLVCQKVVARSPKQVVDDYLVREATTLLDTSGMTIQEIAIRLGFTSQSTFCRFYKKQTGVSPSDAR